MDLIGSYRTHAILQGEILQREETTEREYVGKKVKMEIKINTELEYD